jgi:hypothetical protein
MNTKHTPGSAPSDDNTLGDRNTLGDDNTLGDRNTLGNWNTLGDDNTLGDRNTLGNWNTLGNRNTLGDDNTLGDRNTLGDDNTLGDRNTLGNWNTLGERFKFGARLIAEGVRVLALMCMSNVDGSGRKLTVFVHTKGIKIRAGCFAGSLEEFCAKASAEGKTRYARVVRAAAEALAADVAEKGETGGWDETS